MKRVWWRTALLAAAVAALGWFVYRAPDRAPPEHALSSISAKSARGARLERPGRDAIILEKRGEDWFLTSPLAAPADPLQVERLLAVTQARSPVRLAATDLARFDLERPATRVTIDAQHFDFGIVNEASHEQYVLTGDAVYTISPRYGAALPVRASALVARQVLSGNEVPVSVETGEFTVTQDGGRWALTPASGDLSQDDLQGWIDGWRYASALHVERYAKGDPISEVKMKFRDGTALSLGVLSREPEVAVLRRDRQLVYYLSSGAARRLFASPGAAPEAAASRK